MEVTSNRLSDNSPVRITFRLVGEIQKEDATYTQVFNLKSRLLQVIIV